MKKWIDIPNASELPISKLLRNILVYIDEDEQEKIAELYEHILDWVELNSVEQKLAVATMLTYCINTLDADTGRKN